MDTPWRHISGNLAYGIGTKKDTGSWFKNILHRNLRLDGNYTRARRSRANHAERNTKTGTTFGNVKNTDQFGGNLAT